MSKTKSTSTNKEIKAAVAAITEELDTLEKKHAELKKEMERAGKNALGALKDLINLSPYIEAIKWNQYTPYFNDGDVCEFSVNGIEFKLTPEISGSGDKAGNKKKDDEDEESDEDFKDFGEYGTNLREYLDERKDVLNFKNIDELEAVMDTIGTIHERLCGMDETLLEAFGDHVEVTVTRKGVETTEYEHE